MLGQGTDNDSMSSLLFTIVNTGWKSNTMALTMSHKGRRLKVERRHLGTNSQCSYWKEGSWLFTCMLHKVIRMTKNYYKIIIINDRGGRGGR